jgi:hypothetical protein
MDDIKRFIAQVKREADKDEDFVMERVRLLPLYKKLAEEYDNVDDLAEEAARRAGVYEKVRRFMFDAERGRSHLITTADDKDADRIVWIVQVSRPGLYSKFAWRHGKDEMKKLARTVLSKTRDAHGTYVGK